MKRVPLPWVALAVGHGMRCRDAPPAHAWAPAGRSQPPAEQRAISLSLPRSNGATQSGDAIIASTMQFPLSIIYSTCCTGRTGGNRQDRFFDRREGEKNPHPAGAAGHSRAGPFSRGCRGHRGRPRLGRRALGRRVAPAAGAGAGVRPGQSRLRAAWIEHPRPLRASRKSPV